MDLPGEQCLKEWPAEVTLPTTAQEVKPVSGAADHLIHRHHPVCLLNFRYCLVWISHQTGQKQTATDNQVCPPSRPCTGPWPGNGQVASQKLFKILPSGRRYRTLYPKTTLHEDSFFALTLTLINSYHHSASIFSLFYLYVYFAF